MHSFILRARFCASFVRADSTKVALKLGWVFIEGKNGPFCLFATAAADHKCFVLYFFPNWKKEHEEQMIDRQLALKKTNQTRQSIRNCLTTDRCVEMNPRKPSVLAAASAKQPDVVSEESSLSNLASRFLNSQRTKRRAAHYFSRTNNILSLHVEVICNLPSIQYPISASQSWPRSFGQTQPALQMFSEAPSLFMGRFWEWAQHPELI